ncbi:MAG: zinc ribbon domain-containing protein [Anaerolineae bacterium]
MKRFNWAQVAVFGIVALLVFLVGTILRSFGWGGGMMGGWGGMMGPGHMMYGYSGPWGGLSWALMWLFPLAFLVLITLGVVWLVRAIAWPQGRSTSRSQLQPSKVCPNCDTTVQADWQHCPYCGQGLD